LKVIAYASRIWKDAECRYSTNRQEMSAAIFGLRHFRQYLLGRPFTLRTDHAALQYVLKTKDLNPVHGRYLDFLAQFDGLKIEHRPGINHGNSDGLSRRPAGSCPILFSEMQLETDADKGAEKVNPSEAVPGPTKTCTNRKRERLHQMRRVVTRAAAQNVDKEIRGKLCKPLPGGPAK